MQDLFEHKTTYQNINIGEHYYFRVVCSILIRSSLKALLTVQPRPNQKGSQCGEPLEKDVLTPKKSGRNYIV